MKSKIESLHKELRNTIFLPNYKRNMFDNIPYNPRKDEQRWIRTKVIKLIGFLPLEFL